MKISNAEQSSPAGLVGVVKLMFQERALSLIGLLFVLIAGLATVSGPRFMAHAIDDGLQNKDSQAFYLFALFYIVCEILRPLATMIHTYLFSLAGQRIMQDLRVKLYKHFLLLPAEYFDKNPSGQIVTRLTNDISVVGQLFAAGVVTIVEKVCTLIFVLCALIILDLKLALIALAPFPLILLMGVITSRHLHKVYRLLYATLESINSFLAESILGIKVVQLYSAERSQLESFALLNSTLADCQYKSRRIFAILHPLVTMVTACSVASLIWFGGQMVMAKDVQVGVLLAAITYILWLFWPIIHIIEKWNLFLSGISSADRIFEALTWRMEDGLGDVSQESENLKTLQGEIVFDDVSFAYEPGNWVLKNFTFTFPAGKQTGIVGPSGSGKSTIAALLRRFYEPQRGKILIDGTDIRHFDKRALRAAIGFVQQDLFLFSGSLESNVSLNDEENVDLSLPEYEKLLSHTDFSKVLQERAVNISAGEKQLLSFARCLHSRPQIWILDEASANLDHDAEKKISELLATHAKGRTIISIAHRISSLNKADLILVLHKGIIVESGTPQELMMSNGFYAKLHRLQTASIEVS